MQVREVMWAGVLRGACSSPAAIPLCSVSLYLLIANLIIVMQKGWKLLIYVKYALCGRKLMVSGIALHENTTTVLTHIKNKFI